MVALLLNKILDKRCWLISIEGLDQVIRSTTIIALTLHLLLGFLKMMAA
jgi:hypothetical protein